MSYSIRFRGRDMPDVEVSTERGDKLKEIWFDMNRQDDHIDIDGNAYVVKDIKGFRRTADPIPAKPRDYSQTALTSGRICRGKYSIQKEILRIAREVGGKTSDQNPEGTRWTLLIQDLDWKEMIRHQLREQSGVLWCDHRAGDCACD
jgi:hypothetical protein